MPVLECPDCGSLAVIELRADPYGKTYDTLVCPECDDVDFDLPPIREIAKATCDPDYESDQ